MNAKIDANEKEKKVYNTDWPLFFLFGTLLNFSARTVSEAQASLFSSDNLIRMIFLPLAFFSLMYYCWNYHIFENICIPKPMVWLLLFWGSGIFSFLNNNWLAYSFVKYIEYFVAILSIFYISGMEKVFPGFAQRAFKWLEKFLWVLVISVLVGMIINPTKALYTGDNEYSAIRNALLPILLRGWIIPLSSTSIGMLSSILFYCTITEKEPGTSQKRYIFKLGLLAVCIILAQSRTALLGLVLAVGIYIAVFYKKAFNKLIILTTIIVLLVLEMSTIKQFLLRGQSTELISSLSGRSEWWTYAWNYFMRSTAFSKFWGNGFAAGEKLVASQSNSIMYTLDSEWLAILISNGIIGVILYLGFWASAIKSIGVTLKSGNQQIRNNCIRFLGIAVIIFIRTFTVTTLAVYSYYFLILLISLCCICDNEE